ncbi:4-hydroxyphenylacetate catabolism regulatory protein HpaA [Pseudomonas sp. LABIM340]|uniref:4-hydroxyphenylacetate catabolism regulatory protein HpaA n=1 Tax=Pseudomonas sp. LABIM340 TaxID=3156585 RepID=UPI0032AFE49E
MNSSSPLAAIPILDLGREYDQRYAGADLHYDAHGHLSAFFGRSVAVHRHDRFFQVHYMVRGQVHVYLDDRPYRLQGPMLFFTPPGIPHAFVTDADCEGHVLTVRQQLVWQLFGNGQTSPRPDLRLERPLCVDLGHQKGDLAKDAEQINDLFHLLQREFATDRPGREFNLHAVVRLILVTMLRFSESTQPDWPVHRQDLLLFHRFNQLVEQHYHEHWPLPRYAENLGLTPARLNLVCRRLANMSAKRLVFERLTQEARRLLVHSGLSINEICFTLGFKDPGYFSRFFSQQTGVTPRDFRFCSLDEGLAKNTSFPT